MARKKVKLSWIASDSARKATFKKRRKGLMKKVSELSVLCDVRACAIVYGPQETHPEVWPSPSGAMKVLARFRSMPEMEQCKRMMDQEGFLRQRNVRLQEQLRRHERENRELEASLMLYQAIGGRGLHAASIEDVRCLSWLVETKAKAVHERINTVRRGMASKMAARVEEEERMKQQEQDLSAAVLAQEKNPLEVAMEELQRQEWVMKMKVMNPYEHVVLGPEEMMKPFVDHYDPFPLLDAYFPLN